MKFFSRTKKHILAAKQSLLTLLIAGGLNACATSVDVYGPADEPGAPGYTERQLSENRYRVTFMGDLSSSIGEVNDYALLRAAQVAVYEDYDFFEVASRSTVPVDSTTPSAGGAIAYQTPGAAYTSCGVLGCETHRDPGTIIYEERFPRPDDIYTTSLEIVLLSDASDSKLEDTSVYDAREIIESLL